MGRRIITAVVAFAMALSFVPFAGPASASTSGIVISELRFRGPVGGNDEFVELTNTSAAAVDISGWKLQGCSSSTGAASDRATVAAGVAIPAGGHFLFTNAAAGGYSGTVPGDAAYTVGFSFNSTYEEDFSLVGATTSPTLTVRGQTSTEFIANPALVRMTSTNPANRDRGNYVMFENVSPAADGTFLLTVTPQSTNVGNVVYFPPLNAIQLVKQSEVAAAPPSLSVAAQANGLTISWTADASGYLLESSAALGSTAAWSTVSGTPNPIAGAGSTTVDPALNKAQFYRLRK